MARHNNPDHGRCDAGRIIERVTREADSGSFAIHAARRARDHVAAADADRNDPIEVWGTRIGRVLGLGLVAALLGWLVLFVTGGT